ncbi:MAG: hypothetical protein OEM49_01300 [Myxococcales bacterium]|nr:hypothetical protein [Myxococcales bacterium]MDH5565550.1 hypothetical protein [Myxococcales bacterium]
MSAGASQRRPLATLALAVGGVLCAGALLELGSAALLPRLQREAPPGALRELSPERTRFEELYLSEKILHPYLGYAANPEDPRVNEHGLFGSDPLQPVAQGDAVVGIFGGSVAMSFLETQAQFLEALSRAGAFPERNIRLLHLALDGYKQPQQLILLTYLLGLGAHFDAVLNLDGFNEVALPFAENLPAGVNPFYPRNWHLFAKKGFAPAVARRAALVEQLAERRERWRTRLLGGPLGWSRSLRVFALWLDRRLYADWDRAIRGLEAGLAGERNEFYDLGPARAYATSDELFADLARVWKESSLQMARLCAANGIAYFHFLQPNQYVPGSKPYSKAERETAISGPGFDFRKAVEMGYPQLRDQGRVLRDAGVDFTDLSELFADERETIYVDRCCHMNERGYHRMNDRIAEVISRKTRS